MTFSKKPGPLPVSRQGPALHNCQTSSITSEGEHLTMSSSSASYRRRLREFWQDDGGYEQNEEEGGPHDVNEEKEIKNKEKASGPTATVVLSLLKSPLTNNPKKNEISGADTPHEVPRQGPSFTELSGAKSHGEKQDLETWYKHLNELATHIRRNGEVKITTVLAESPSLAEWVNEVRRHVKGRQAGEMTPLSEDQVKHLNDIGFLRSFKEEEFGLVGDSNDGADSACEVVTEPGDVSISVFQPSQSEVVEARDNEALQSLYNWYKYLNLLHRYKSKHGDTKVPQKYDKVPGLGRWADCQRELLNQYSSGETKGLSEIMVVHLQDIGFIQDSQTTETRVLAATSGRSRSAALTESIEEKAQRDFMLREAVLRDAIPKNRNLRKTINRKSLSQEEIPHEEFIRGEILKDLQKNMLKESVARRSIPGGSPDSQEPAVRKITPYKSMPDGQNFWGMICGDRSDPMYNRLASESPCWEEAIRRRRGAFREAKAENDLIRQIELNRSMLSYEQHFDTETKNREETTPAAMMLMEREKESLVQQEMILQLQEARYRREALERELALRRTMLHKMAHESMLQMMHEDMMKESGFRHGKVLRGQIQEIEMLQSVPSGEAGLLGGVRQKTPQDETDHKIHVSLEIPSSATETLPNLKKGESDETKPAAVSSITPSMKDPAAFQVGVPRNSKLITPVKKRKHEVLSPVVQAPSNDSDASDSEDEAEVLSVFRPTPDELEDARTERSRKSLMIWYRRLNELYAYKVANNGATNVPKDSRLGRWVIKLRRKLKQHDAGELTNLTLQKIQHINSLGFYRGKSHTESWNEKFDALMDFRAENGHCNVHRRYPQHQSLADWVKKQRQLKKAGKLATDRIEKLERIGFQWQTKGKQMQNPTGNIAHRIFLDSGELTIPKTHASCAQPEG